MSADHSRDALLTIIRALVVSKVDYCITVLVGVADHLLTRLQAVLNAAARLIFSSRKYDHITPLLRELHWLRVPERIQFRLCVQIYRCLHGMAPAYLAQDLERISDVDARRRLRSGSSSALVVPTTRRSTIGDRSYQVAGPRAWNSLPTSVRDQLTLLTFRSHLKTFLFSLSFD